MGIALCFRPTYHQHLYKMVFATTTRKPKCSIISSVIFNFAHSAGDGAWFLGWERQASTREWEGLLNYILTLYIDVPPVS